jgi:glycosyltransferase involved in cell wall biosynthesis
MKIASRLMQRNLNFEWRIVGCNTGDYFIKYTEAIYKKKFKDVNVSFEGVISEAKLINVLKNSDLFFHPSHLENECISVLEAMAICMPIIAVISGGMGTYLQSGFNGIAVRDYDVDQGVGEIVNIVENEKKAKSMGDRARKFALAAFDTSKTVKKTINVYRKVAEVN